MASKTVLIVEDEGIVALSIRETLRKLGYYVAGISATGADAIEQAASHLPDVILMDIHLKGDIDGIEAARQINLRFSIPIIYLTAYTDDETLQRAMKTQPHSYLVKPFNERELYSNIEFAIYKQRVKIQNQSDLKSMETLLYSTPDPAILLDTKSNIIYLNPTAESMLGYANDHLKGKNIFHTLGFHSIRHEMVFTPETQNKIINRPDVSLLNDTVQITTRSEKKKNIGINTCLISDNDQNLNGILIFLRQQTSKIV